jgi:hypothetical protein
MQNPLKILWRSWVILGFSCALSAAPLKIEKAADPFRYVPMGVSDGCFVESVALSDEVGARYGAETWRRVLQWGAKEDDEVVAGHAVAVFTHAEKVWAYDINFGFTALTIPTLHRDDPALVAAPLTAKYPKIIARFPVYREDAVKEPMRAPPALYEGVEERGLRDASLVAARLARYRRVGLVAFTYSQAGETRTTAAVVFVFSGRLCVYVSGYGTVPFRTRVLSIDNLRQLQLMLRRMYPGASELKSRSTEAHAHGNRESDNLAGAREPTGRRIDPKNS